jgi:hypothetical protein
MYSKLGTLYTFRTNVLHSAKEKSILCKFLLRNHIMTKYMAIKKYLPSKGKMAEYFHRFENSHELLLLLLLLIILFFFSILHTFSVLHCFPACVILLLLLLLFQL